MVIALDQLCIGVQAYVIGIDTAAQLQQRLQDFGMVPGTGVQCRYRSPRGDVLAIELRGSVLALRRRDAHGIQVRVSW